MSKCVIIANKCTKVDGAVVLLNMPYNAGFQGKTQVFLIQFSNAFSEFKVQQYCSHLHTIVVLYYCILLLNKIPNIFIIARLLMALPCISPYTRHTGNVPIVVEINELSSGSSLGHGSSGKHVDVSDNARSGNFDKWLLFLEREFGILVSEFFFGAFHVPLAVASRTVVPEEQTQT